MNNPILSIIIAYNQYDDTLACPTIYIERIETGWRTYKLTDLRVLRVIKAIAYTNFRYSVNIQ